MNKNKLTITTRSGKETTVETIDYVDIFKNTFFDVSDFSHNILMTFLSLKNNKINIDKLMELEEYVEVENALDILFQ